MVILTPKEREILLSLSLLHISQMLNVSTFGNMADIYAIVQLVPHACQHITVDLSHSSCDTVAKILTFTECHIWYYYLLAANQGNYVHGCFLGKKLGEFLSLLA
jgi:hypothetical protein